ncbi:MAG: TatD family hydrolase [Bacteroidales bacterium]
MNLVDLHSHKLDHYDCNIAISQIELYDLVPNGLYSFGIHPWCTLNELRVDLLFSRLKMLLDSPNPPFAIGECGLDKLRGASMDRQIEALELQLKLSIQYNRPVIIHCVKAWDQLLSLINLSSFKDVKIVIHGFRGSPQLMNQLIKRPNLWLSFGVNYREDTLRDIPIDRLFIETDTSDVKIDDLYSQIALSKNISKQELVGNINKNFIQLK